MNIKQGKDIDQVGYLNIKLIDRKNFTNSFFFVIIHTSIFNTPCQVWPEVQKEV